MTTKLKTERLARDWRQQDLGRKLGVKQPAVHGWETGKTRPTWARRRKLERIFGIPAAALLAKEASAEIKTPSVARQD